MTKMEDPAFAEQAGKILHLSSTMEQAFYKANVMDDLIKDVDTMRHCIKLGVLTQEASMTKLASFLPKQNQLLIQNLQKSCKKRSES